MVGDSFALPLELPQAAGFEAAAARCFSLGRSPGLEEPDMVVALLPMVYVVWWKRNLKLGIIVHCVVVALGFLFITLGVVALMLDLV